MTLTEQTLFMKNVEFRFTENTFNIFVKSVLYLQDMTTFGKVCRAVSGYLTMEGNNPG